MCAHLRSKYISASLESLLSPDICFGSVDVNNSREHIFIFFYRMQQNVN